MSNIFNSGYFPEVTLAGEDGLLAVGGSLEVPILLEAYSKGIFPWYAEGSPILWWSPDPRMVLFPDRFKVSKSLGQTLRKGDLKIRLDSCFSDVIRHCSKVPRPDQDGTWITEEMIMAYILLHEEGYAHSVEVFSGGELVGGLYGVSLGKAFFGESMFHLRKDASKVALYHLVEFARQNNFELIDTQQSTPHLKSLGAEEIPRIRFLYILQQSLTQNTIKGSWE
ncbi:MAG: leucyl/phenylalanyl-tRNA--protein transferase [Bacteroidales bacterium]|nr:leucyl/phenylalanyl-tRNA--protein transferase [Bacteroidales bacterium]